MVGCDILKVYNQQPRSIIKKKFKWKSSWVNVEDKIKY